MRHPQPAVPSVSAESGPGPPGADSSSSSGPRFPCHLNLHLAGLRLRTPPGARDRWTSMTLRILTTSNVATYVLMLA
eukprot:2477434-Alexandrium_andersonii.AAC.1